VTIAMHILFAWADCFDDCVSSVLVDGRFLRSRINDSESGDLSKDVYCG
jgi:hypothetical protein